MPEAAAAAARSDLQGLQSLRSLPQVLHQLSDTFPIIW